MQRPPPPDYLRRSTVRGQLEPPDPHSAKGWRYIQTTDTVNQLKVLLPPGTASMYEQLLKLEDYELCKGSSLSWERILEIRHLKDRMIRKCQRLVKTSPERPSGESISLSFQTIVAPADFRLKEMEKWFLDQHARTQQKRHERGASAPCKCSKCLSPTSQPDAWQPSNPKSVVDPSSQRKPESRKLYPRPRNPSQPISPSRIEKSESIPVQNSSAITPLAARSAVASPPPLPHLLRIRDLETGFDKSDDPQRIGTLPRNEPPEPDSESERESPERVEPAFAVVANGELRRRPSCIKRSSTNFKRVSWADTPDLEAQVSKYTSIAREVQASGLKWEEIRDTYVEQMLGLEALHQQVGESIEHLRSESEHLKRTDEAIKTQKEMLYATFQDFERKQIQFQAKVQQVLNDADHALSLATAKQLTTT
ncbi:hypothetical protein H0H92_003111 [Tricholoma furcatifolium]|nr:hypothetical protein H0H92_003111 [Tricholoma furcatifolium]